MTRNNKNFGGRNKKKSAGRFNSGRREWLIKYYKNDFEHAAYFIINFGVSCIWRCFEIVYFKVCLNYKLNLNGESDQVISLASAFDAISTNQGVTRKIIKKTSRRQGNIQG